MCANAATATPSRRPAGGSGPLAICLLFALVLGWILVARGLPHVVQRELVERANRGNLAVAVERVLWRPPLGLLARGVQVHQKGAIGPARLEAAEVEVRARWPWLWRRMPIDADEPPLLTVRVRGGRVRHAPTETEPSDRPRPLRQTCTLLLQQCDVEGVWIESCRGRLAVDGRLLTLRNARGTAGVGHHRGDFRVDVTLDRETHAWTIEAEASAAPETLSPFLAGRGLQGLNRLLADLDVSARPPTYQARLERGAGRDATVTVEGRFTAQECVFRGVDLTHADLALRGAFSATNAYVILAPVRLMRADRTLVADARIDLREGATVLRGVSSLNPHAVARLIGEGLEQHFAGIGFGDRTEVTIRGRVVAGRPEQNDLTLSVDGSGLDWGAARLGAYEADLEILGHTARVSRARGELWGGRFQALGVVRRDPGGGSAPAFELQVTAEDMAFPEIAQRVFHKPPDLFPGRLSAKGDVVGALEPDWLREAQGRLFVEVRDSMLFRVPLFGGLTELLSSVIPRLDKLLEQTAATATVTLGEGMARTEDLAIEGDIIRIEGKGRYRFDQDLDFTVKVTMRKNSLVQRLVRLPLDVLNEVFFEIRLTGTPENPRWYMHRFSKDIFDRFRTRDEGT